jgi:hypothetical protein
MKSRCSGCGAEVIWIKTKVNRRKMPVDAEPVWIIPGGRDSFVNADGAIIMGRKIGDAWDDDPDANVVQVYESHFATCPVGGQFRNRNQRTRPSGYR